VLHPGLAEAAVRRVTEELRQMASVNVQEALVIAGLKVDIRLRHQCIIPHHFDPPGIGQSRNHARLAFAEQAAYAGLVREAELHAMIQPQLAEMDFLVGWNHRHHLTAHPVEQHALGHLVWGYRCRARGFGAGLAVRMRDEIEWDQMLVEKTFHAMQGIHDRLLKTDD